MKNRYLGFIVALPPRTQALARHWALSFVSPTTTVAWGLHSLCRQEHKLSPCRQEHTPLPDHGRYHTYVSPTTLSLRFLIVGQENMLVRSSLWCVLSQRVISTKLVIISYLFPIAAAATKRSEQKHHKGTNAQDWAKNVLHVRKGRPLSYYQCICYEYHYHV